MTHVNRGKALMKAFHIGYSCWGFLGDGVINTPDGSRSYRRPVLDELQAAGHRVTLLQRNRDLHEAGVDQRDQFAFSEKFPDDLDVLMLEWRWPLPGRNTTACDAPGHTCDLHRQTELLGAYTFRGLPTVIWDLDRRLPADAPIRQRPNVRVCEFATRPNPGAATVLCPVPDAQLDAMDPYALARLPRPLSLVYVGNQYDRDDHFATFFAPAAAYLEHEVAGKWTRTEPWPHVNFTGRCAFPEVEQFHRGALATVLLAPERYRTAGHITQRIFEAVLAGCIPLMPADVVDGERFVPAGLVVADAADVVARVEMLQRIHGTEAHGDLLWRCRRRLDQMRLSRQVAVLQQVIGDPLGIPAR